jgi:cytochrome c peroxidase
MKGVFRILLFFVSLNFASCKVDPKINTPLPANNLVPTIPDGWPQPKYNFEENPISEDRFILGRALFYETLLSKDNSVSCSSCHQNFVAFANADHKFSHGINGQFGTRNAPAIFNLNWHPYLMQDGGSNSIENQPLGPIGNPVEMNETLADIINKLQSSIKYRSLFKSAYGDEAVNSQRILKSLAQFMGLMYSYNSKYDQYKRHEQGIAFTDAEYRGYNLFLAQCNICHKEPLFSDFAFRSNGLIPDPVLNDTGRARITGLTVDKYKFKTPSLRNVGLTKPYMHDGRFETLEECLDHYTDPSKNTINLDQLLSSPLVLSAQDKQDIISFLNTLTDYQFINDKRFADPNFK